MRATGQLDDVGGQRREALHVHIGKVWRAPCPPTIDASFAVHSSQSSRLPERNQVLRKDTGDGKNAKGSNARDGHDLSSAFRNRSGSRSFASVGWLRHYRVRNSASTLVRLLVLTWLSC